MCPGAPLVPILRLACQEHLDRDGLLHFCQHGPGEAGEGGVRVTGSPQSSLGRAKYSNLLQ